MIDGVDPNNRLGVSGADGSSRVLAGLFAEGALVSGLLARRRNLSLDGDLRMGWNRQSADGSFDDIQRPAAQPTDKIKFRSAPGDFGVGGHEGERVLAEGGDDGTALSLF